MGFSAEVVASSPLVPGLQATIARYRTVSMPQYQTPAAPATASSAATPPTPAVTYVESPVPSEELAVVNGLGKIMQQPGAKHIVLNVNRRGGTTVDPAIMKQVLLIETTSRLRYGGRGLDYTITVAADPGPETAP